MFKTIKAFIEYNRTLKELDVLRKDMNKKCKPTMTEKIAPTPKRRTGKIYERQDGTTASW